MWELFKEYAIYVLLLNIVLAWIVREVRNTKNITNPEKRKQARKKYTFQIIFSLAVTFLLISVLLLIVISQ